MRWQMFVGGGEAHPDHVQTLDAEAQRRTDDQKDACSAGSLHMVAWPPSAWHGACPGTPGRLEI
jgi:hypothetical protein